MATPASSTARGRESLVRARAAYDEWLVAESRADGARALALLGHRALVAALDAQLHAATTASGLGLSAALFALSRAALDAEADWDEEDAPEFSGAWERAQARMGRGGAVSEAPPPHRAASAAPSEPPGPMTLPPPPEPPPLTAYSLERCAAIAASIARRNEDRSNILTSNELTDERWSELEARWAETIRLDIQKGKTESLSSYDEAYVAQLEIERGPIQVEELARLSVASERGVEEETLAELGLPRPSLQRIQRVWLRRTAADRALAKRVRDAIDADEG